MASAKRRGHVYHLDAERVTFTRKDREVSIGVLPVLVSKQESEYNKPIDHTVVIMALSDASDQVDKSLCQVRAVCQYLKAQRAIPVPS